MKVILLERVEGKGALGDVVTVKDGYARNFLLPRAKALRANNANMKVFEGQQQDIRTAALEVLNGCIGIDAYGDAVKIILKQALDELRLGGAVRRHEYGRVRFT